MSQENVEAVRVAFQAWDPEDTEGFAMHLDPTFEYEMTYGPEKVCIEAGSRSRRLASPARAFSEFRWQADDFIDAGHDRIVVPFIEGGHGRASGVQTEQEAEYGSIVRKSEIRRLT